MPGARAPDNRVRPDEYRVAAVLERARACLGARVTLDALVLFGSRARGEELDTSDWDLAVVSRDFAGLNPLQRGLRIVDCRLPGIEPIPLTPDELLRPEVNYLRCAVLEEGVPLIDSGAFARAKARYEQEKAAGRIRFRGAYVEFAPSAGEHSPQE
ncbi:MAG: nucleotidyltransferase domain-containing protein [Gemmatimonadales bacterium]